jgi:phosphate transport system substrate-binding protein
MSYGKSIHLGRWLLLFSVLAIVIAYAPFTTLSARKTLDIQGSLTVEKIVDLSRSTFMNDYRCSIEVQGTGTGTGIGTLINGGCDIAMASRPVKSSENSTCFDISNDYLRSTSIAKQALVMISNEIVNDSLDLSWTDIRGIYNGSIAYWNDPFLTDSGLSGPIEVVSREAGSSERDIFIELGMRDDTQCGGEIFREDLIIFDSDIEIIDYVATHNKSIGYVTFGSFNNSNSSIKAVTLDTVIPNRTTILDSSYWFARDLFLVALGYPSNTSLIWQYIDWQLNPDGQYFVYKAGFINIYPKSNSVSSVTILLGYQSYLFFGLSVIFLFIIKKRKRFEDF